MVFLDIFVLITEPQSLTTFSQPKKDVKCIAQLLLVGLCVNSSIYAILLTCLNKSAVPGSIYDLTHCFHLSHSSGHYNFLHGYCLWAIWKHH